MRPVYAIASSIISPLGETAAENFEKILAAESAVSLQADRVLVPFDFWASKFSEEQLAKLQISNISSQYSIFESLCIEAVEQALAQTNVNASQSDCIFILSTTKGNIEFLGKEPEQRVAIAHSAQQISDYFNLAHQPMVVSNACISGALALIWAKRFLETGKYKHAIVVGADRLSGFVVSGFQSFQAIAPERCTPFDENRKGINLGETASCIVLSTEIPTKKSDFFFQLKGGGVSNDANHLSGPSRTGEELAQAITDALREADLQPSAIGAISAHGTGTSYNDEMEVQAINVAGLSHVPVHSLKPLIGHTLGAAGIIESVIACLSMQNNTILGSQGFETSGVSVPVNISSQNKQSTYFNLLKTASGFGGCNAALVWGRAEI